MISQYCRSSWGWICAELEDFPALEWSSKSGFVSAVQLNDKRNKGARYCVADKHVKRMTESVEKQSKCYLWLVAMHNKIMRARRIPTLVLAILCFNAALRSQDRFFLYIQTENEQAFYARYQGRAISSSATGYLILPKIMDSVCSLTIGFPKRLFTEQSFLIRGISADRGFLLKNMGEKGWALIDMQQNDMVMATNADAPVASVATPPVSSDPFSELLSTAIADSTLRETPIVVKPVPSSQTLSKPVTGGSTMGNAQVRKTTDTVAANTNVKTEILPRPEKAIASSVSATESRGKSLKILEQIDATGVQLVYADEPVNGSADTVSIWIPRTSAQPPAPKPQSPVTTQSPAKSMADNVMSTVLDRNDCKSFMSVKDLGLLRRRMEALTDEDAKVSLAVRSLRESCLNTEQIRSLLVVFGREEGRFKLMDAAYQHVSDPSRFTELESVLKDPYFIYRFRKKTSQPPVR